MMFFSLVAREKYVCFVPAGALNSLELVIIPVPGILFFFKYRLQCEVPGL